MAMTKMQLKEYRDRMIVSQHMQGIAVEELAYIYNISSQRVQEVLRNRGINANVNAQRAKEMKSSKVTSRGYSNNMYVR